MFSERLKQLRKSHPGLTQEAIAKQIGIAKTTYASYEQGKRQPAYDILVKLADILNTSVDYLIGKNNVKNDDSPEWANDDDKRDLAKFLEYNDGTMMYQGENLTEEEKEKLEIAMTQIFWKRRKQDKK